MPLSQPQPPPAVPLGLGCLGGFLMAFSAGGVNSVGLLGFKHQAVSHLTGVSTFLSLEIAALQLAEVAHLALIVVSFLLGAIAAGALINPCSKDICHKHLWALGLQGGLLLIAIGCFGQHLELGYYLCACACGLQNGITSRFKGLALRTTHVSGVFTDIGLMLGATLAGGVFNGYLCLLFGALILGFISGGVAGAVLYASVEYRALWLPCAVTWGCVLLTALWLFKQRRAGMG